MATGWGNKLWGEDSWGDLSDAIASPSGQQLTSSVDQVTNTGDSNVDVTGLQITSTIGNQSIRFDAGVFPTGTQSSFTLGTTTEVIIDHEVSLTGLSASTNIGSVTATAELQVGWGGDTWGENAWGDLSGAFANPTGIQASFSVGEITTTANANIDVTGIQLTATNAGAVGGTSVDQLLTGQQLQIFNGEEVVGIGVPVTGSQATTSAGQTTIDPTYLIGAGWGRDTFGNLGWGVNYSVIPAEGTGIELTASLGDELAITDVEVTVTAPDALQITYASPSFSIQIDQDIFVLASEDQLDAEIGTIADVTGTATVDITGIELTSNIGQVVGGTRQDVPVTGTEATMSLGTIALEQSTNEPATGQELTSSIGEAEEIPAQIVGVSGIQLTANIGSVTVTGNALVTPTGIELTSTAGSLNITSWQEVDPGVNNVWSEVDLAA